MSDLRERIEELQRKTNVYKQELFNLGSGCSDIRKMVEQAVPDGQINEDSSKAIFEKLSAIHTGIREALLKAAGRIE